MRENNQEGYLQKEKPPLEEKRTLGKKDPVYLIGFSGHSEPRNMDELKLIAQNLTTSFEEHLSGAHRKGWIELVEKAIESKRTTLEELGITREDLKEAEKLSEEEIVRYQAYMDLYL